MNGAALRRGPRALALRWVHLLLGGALLMPYFLLMTVAIGVAFPDADLSTHLGWQLLAYVLCFPLVALTGVFPLARPLEADAARALSGVSGLAAGPARSWAARRRTAVWFTAHVGIGGLLSGMTLAVPPMVAVLLILPFSGGLREGRVGERLGVLSDHPWPAPLAGLLLLAALIAAAAGAGALLARLAPALLGPTPADRLAAAERRAADLAARNRLARELHDSVGHALSTVTLQAGAARKVLDADPAFAGDALAAIEEAARGAVAELDTVLGLLRDEDSATKTPSPTLADLDALLDRTRSAGLTVELDRAGTGPGLPAVVSREAYRIIQEGLSNALRHAGPVPLTLRITTTEGELTISMENPAPRTGGPRPGGGRGLRGIAERATLLGGATEWGTSDGIWHLTTRFPLGTPS
jgi:signal transduction histidine kinase